MCFEGLPKGHLQNKDNINNNNFYHDYFENLGGLKAAWLFTKRATEILNCTSEQNLKHSKTSKRQFKIDQNNYKEFFPNHSKILQSMALNNLKRSMLPNTHLTKQH